MPEFAIHGITLGMTREQVLSRLGEGKWEGQLGIYSEQQLRVILKNGKVDVLEGTSLTRDGRLFLELPMAAEDLAEGGFLTNELALGEVTRAETGLFAPLPDGSVLELKARRTADADATGMEWTVAKCLLTSFSTHRALAERMGWPGRQRKAPYRFWKAENGSRDLGPRHSLAWPWVWLGIGLLQFGQAFEGQPIIQVGEGLVGGLLYGGLLSGPGYWLDRQIRRGRWRWALGGSLVGVLLTLLLVPRFFWFLWPTLAVMGGFAGGGIEAVRQRQE